METLSKDIQQNLAEVQGRIAQAARSAGRTEQDVRLVVVTKSKPVEVIRAAIAAGARIFGENYPQEAVGKIQTLQTEENIQWYMIGHLQSRKASLIAEHFDMLQSLDSLHLAEKLERQLAERAHFLPTLIEFNVSGEESKFGWAAWEENRWEQLLPDLEKVLLLPHLHIEGVMTMPPYADDPEEARVFFARLRRLAEFLSGHFGAEHFQEFSMGTSADYEIAVQEGATFVRIGTAILGPRLPKA